MMLNIGFAIGILIGLGFLGLIVEMVSEQIFPLFGLKGRWMLLAVLGAMVCFCLVCRIGLINPLIYQANARISLVADYILTGLGATAIGSLIHIFIHLLLDLRKLVQRLTDKLE
jgi:predicted membrane protein